MFSLQESFVSEFPINLAVTLEQGCRHGIFSPALFSVAPSFLTCFFLAPRLPYSSGSNRYPSVCLREDGIHRRQVFVLLLLSLLGSYVNIPVAQLPAEKITSGQEIFFFGMRYVIPLVQEWPRTVIAVNLGGAVVPTLVSLYLMVKNKLYVRGLMSVTIVAAIVHWLAQPVAAWESPYRSSFLLL